jgi:hypothetical protein
MRLLTGPNASGIGASTCVFYDTCVSMNEARRGWVGRLTVPSLARWSRLTRTIACAACLELCVLELYGGWSSKANAFRDVSMYLLVHDRGIWLLVHDRGICLLINRRRQLLRNRRRQLLINRQRQLLASEQTASDDPPLYFSLRSAQLCPPEGCVGLVFCLHPSLSRAEYVASTQVSSWLMANICTTPTQEGVGR